MKQLKHLVLYLPFVLAAVGCSQDELTPDGGTGTGVPEGLHEVEITFNMGTSAGLQTRAIPRPVISSDNWQRVTNVRIYVFKAENADASDDAYYYQPNINDGKGYLYVSNFADTKKDWEEDDVWGDETDEQENEYYTYSAKLQLESGYYKFLAVGRDDIDETDHSTMVFSDPCLNYPSEYPEEFIETAKAFSEGESINYSPEEPDEWTNETTLDEVKFVSSVSPCGTELFTACSQAIPIDTENTGFSATMKLNRAVAGMLLHVTKIPTNYESMVTIQRKISGKNKKFVTKGKQYPVSDIAICSPEILHQVFLNGRLPVDEQKTDNIETYENENLELPFLIQNLSDLTDNGKGYYEKYNKGEWEPDTCLIGTYILPHPKTTKSIELGTNNTETTLDKTLYLVFYTTATDDPGVGTSPIYWRPIKLTNNIPASEDETHFSIRANCFYSIGEKKYEDGTDKPIDLTSNAVITVNPDWDWKGELEWAD